MAKYGKWLGAGLGFAMGGPLGALFGLFIGSLFDSVEVMTTGDASSSAYQTGRGDFMFSLTVLATAIMKADGKITRNELDYVKKFLKTNFGEEATLEALAMMKKLSTEEIRVEAVCQQIRYHMDPSLRLQLLYFLFGIAQADGNVCEKEIRLLETIALQLGMDTTSFNSVKGMYYDDLDSAYATLGIDRNATDEEIKKAYRKMAVENHPDKVGHLGEDIRKAAEEKFTHINLAYEKIKKQRGLT